MLRHDDAPVNLKPDWEGHGFSRAANRHPKRALAPEVYCSHIPTLSSRPEEIIAKAMICGVESLPILP